MADNRRHIILAAGGTGGHIYPAHALAEECLARGHKVSLITDKRGKAWPGLNLEVEVHLVEAGDARRRGPMGLLKTALGVRRGVKQSSALYKREKPHVVVGFGGYPALPALLAARLEGIKYCLHEQNAVLGRVNRFMAGHAAAIAVSWAQTERLKGSWRKKTALTGNPVRPALEDLRGEPYPLVSRDSLLRILVLGGSQGARILSTVVPDAIRMLPPGLQRRLQITQQCRAEDIERVRDLYAAESIAAELATFIEDVADRLRWAHLVISRAGASTTSELAVAGRPAILVPYAAATDDHQRANAEDMRQAGGAIVLSEKEFKPITLAKHLQRLATAPAQLIEMAEASRSVGRPEATIHLANMVEYVLGLRDKSGHGRVAA
ncbi:MAG: undecaprenyldiphospho-muramoylpentapeptide beta-N-acetylglucosaminyltransferase [Sphingomonadales bacterium]|jgi:UDP-N-acetylglucosamine--N-acetylmuramyl-(pentapeptide) pyrophosphoryl-undecaprenol N-acetylglucosamine transferase